jgi:pyruvate kinase
MDGCDAVMLSGETSYGEHPINAIEVMNRISQRAELWRQRHMTRAMTEQILMDIYDSYNANSDPQMSQIDDEIAHAVFNLANGIDCHLIACLTATGATPRRVSRFRGRRPVVAGVSSTQVMQELFLSYGIHPVLLTTKD